MRGPWIVHAHPPPQRGGTALIPATARVLVESHDGELRLERVATLANDPASSSTRSHGAPPSLAGPRAEVALLTIPGFALVEWKCWLAASQAERDAMLPEKTR